MVKRPRREYLDHHQSRIRQNVRTKVKKSRSNATFKLMLLYGFLIFLIGILVILYINQYVQISRMNFEVEKLEEKRDKLKTEQAHLQLDISELKSLSRIEKIAKNKLGMIEPNKVKYIVSSKPLQKDKLETSKHKENSRNKTNFDKSIKDRLLVWFSTMSKVQAGTLE
ncbi:cell division protein FtsL [Orenia marismortui]|uniref:Cell division protein FtsL n=1 Tax=Orenia marismortui TaxID=46469 RepID=A0A4V3GYK0_9FIRM|nr:cell division protein FtsL [Orenia marismortui]TDX53021.1 cell division protein FtsL [Orenia marismortui]